MPFCPKCGREVKEDAVFCPFCGESLKKTDVIYKKGVSGGLTALKVLAIIFGGILILGGAGALIGGGVLTSARGSIEDSEGFIMSRAYRGNVNTYAIVTDALDVRLDYEQIGGIWKPSPQDVVTIKIEATNNSPSKQVFIGIARQQDLQSYLVNMLYSRVQGMNFRYDPSGQPSPLSTVTHPGVAPSAPPTVLSSWVIAPATGSGTQTLRWTPQTGTYYVIVMNADGSTPVDVTIRVGAKVPFLSTIGNVLIFSGIIVIIIGSALVYLGFRRR